MGRGFIPADKHGPEDHRGTVTVQRGIVGTREGGAERVRRLGGGIVCDTQEAVSYGRVLGRGRRSAGSAAPLAQSLAPVSLLSLNLPFGMFVVMVPPVLSVLLFLVVPVVLPWLFLIAIYE